MFTFPGTTGKFKKVKSALLEDLVAWWKFEEGSGTTVSDSTSVNNQGTATGGFSWASGKEGTYAGGFNGSNSVVTVADAPELNPTSEITICAWLYQDSLSDLNTAGLIVGKGGVDLVGGYELGVKATDVNFSLHLTGGKVWSSPDFSMTTGTWNHIALTYNGSDIFLYKDGVILYQNTGSGTIITGSHVLTLGKRTTGNNNIDYLDGRLDDVRIYSRALSTAEIVKIYNENN